MRRRAQVCRVQCGVCSPRALRVVVVPASLTTQNSPATLQLSIAYSL